MTRRAWTVACTTRMTPKRALRAAKRLGGNEPAIAKARIALLNKDRQARRCSMRCPPRRATISATCSPACRCCGAATTSPRRWQLMKTLPQDARRQPRYRRMVGGAPPAGPQAARRRRSQDAYEVSRDATLPTTRQLPHRAPLHGRLDRAALTSRPATAYAHFGKIPESSDNPISLARGAYWMGRAAEACGRASRRAAITRRRRATRPPITARSRAPSSGWAN